MPHLRYQLAARHKGQRGTSTNVRQQAIGCVAMPVPVGILAVVCATNLQCFLCRVVRNANSHSCVHNAGVAKPMLFYRDEQHRASEAVWKSFVCALMIICRAMTIFARAIAFDLRRSRLILKSRCCSSSATLGVRFPRSLVCRTLLDRRRELTACTASSRRAASEFIGLLATCNALFRNLS